MAEHCTAGGQVAGVVRARGVERSAHRATERIRPSEHVMHVWRVTNAVDGQSFFGKRVNLVHLIAIAHNVAVQIGHSRRDQRTLGIVPRPRADAIARVDRLAVSANGTEIRMPRASDQRAESNRLGECLTVSVGAGQSTEIGPITFADTGDEERHRSSRLRGGGSLRNGSGVGNGERGGDNQQASVREHGRIREGLHSIWRAVAHPSSATLLLQERRVRRSGEENPRAASSNAANANVL